MRVVVQSCASQGPVEKQYDESKRQLLIYADVRELLFQLSA